MIKLACFIYPDGWELGCLLCIEAIDVDPLLCRMIYDDSQAVMFL